MYQESLSLVEESLVGILRTCRRPPTFLVNKIKRRTFMQNCKLASLFVASNLYIFHKLAHYSEHFSSHFASFMHDIGHYVIYFNQEASMRS